MAIQGYLMMRSDARNELMNRGPYSRALHALDKTFTDYGRTAYEDYSDTIESAYIAAERNKSMLDSVNYGSTMGDVIRGDVDAQLSDAYRQAADAYQQNISSLGEQYQKSYGQISQEAGAEVDFMDKALSAYFDYYDYLRQSEDFENYNVSNAFKNENEYMSKSQLLNKAFATDPNTGETTLTNEGKEWLSLLGDIDKYGYAGSTFKDYILENDIDLYDWLRRQNVLDQSKSNSQALRESYGIPDFTEGSELAKKFVGYNPVTGQTGTGEWIGKDLEAGQAILTGSVTNVKGKKNAEGVHTVGTNAGKYNNFDIIRNGVAYEFETGKKVTDQIAIDNIDAILNKRNKVAENGDIVVSGGVAYVYANDDNWHYVEDRAILSKNKGGDDQISRLYAGLTNRPSGLTSNVFRSFVNNIPNGETRTYNEVKSEGSSTFAKPTSKSYPTYQVSKDENGNITVVDLRTKTPIVEKGSVRSFVNSLNVQ